MSLCVSDSAGEFPAEINISGEQLVQITGIESCSLDETTYIGLFWFKQDKMKENYTEEHFSWVHMGSA